MRTDQLRSSNPIRAGRPDRLVLARFSAAELAAAANLVQLSESSGDSSSADALGIGPAAAEAAAVRGGDYSSSPRSVNTRLRDDAAAAAAEEEEEEEGDDEVGGGGALRGRRRRRRYRLIADLYKATAPIGDGGNPRSEKRRRSEEERE